MIPRAHFPDEKPPPGATSLWRQAHMLGTTVMFSVGVSQAEYLGGGGRLVCARVAHHPSILSNHPVRYEAGFVRIARI